LQVEFMQLNPNKFVITSSKMITLAEFLKIRDKKTTDLRYFNVLLFPKFPLNVSTLLELQKVDYYQAFPYLKPDFIGCVESPPSFHMFYGKAGTFQVLSVITTWGDSTF
jgi:hypothetical protein